MEENKEFEIQLIIPDEKNKDILNNLMQDKNFVNKQIKLVFLTSNSFDETQSAEIINLIHYVESSFNVNPSKITAWVDFDNRNMFDKAEYEQLKIMSETLKRQGTKSYLFSTVEGSGEDEVNSPKWEIEKVIETNLEINKTVNFVKENKLSPLEALLYYYMTVTSKAYKEEEEWENANLSRHVFSVVLGDKIVCVGFAEWLELLSAVTMNPNLSVTGLGAFLKYNDEEEPEFEDTNHQTLLAYINDAKYGVRGYSQLEPTAEVKYKDYFHSSLVYFMIPFMDMQQVKKASTYTWNEDLIEALKSIEIGKQIVNFNKDGDLSLKIKDTDLSVIFNRENKINKIKEEVNDYIKLMAKKDIYVSQETIEEFLKSPLDIYQIYNTMREDFNFEERETEDYPIKLDSFFKSLTKEDINLLVQKATEGQINENLDLFSNNDDLTEYLPENDNGSALQIMSSLTAVCSYETIERALGNVLYKMGMNKEQIEKYLTESKIRNIENFEKDFNKKECSSSLAGYELPKEKERVI